MARASDIDTVFCVIKDSLPVHGAKLVKECGSVYGFQITKNDGKSLQYTLDLSQGSGRFEKGLQPGVNATISANESDAVAFLTGQSSFSELYTSGKLKVAGSVGRVIKLKQSSLSSIEPDIVRKRASPRL